MFPSLHGINPLRYTFVPLLPTHTQPYSTVSVPAFGRTRIGRPSMMLPGLAESLLSSPPFVDPYPCPFLFVPLGGD